MRKKLALVLLPLVSAAAQTGTAAWTGPSAAEIDAVYPDIEALYIDLHRNPELAFHETQTAAKLAARVKSLGYEVTEGVAGTGIVAILKNGSGPTVMLRTELDALPVEEKTGLAFASKVVVKNEAGENVHVAHACGHDIHMSAWAGTAKLMAEHRQQWRGTLMLIGQPAEEGAAGASAMLKDGLFTRFAKPDFALSLHDDDTLPVGQIGYHAGYFRAISDRVIITIIGRGGHAAAPQNTIDPIVIAARTVLALQTLVSRENNPADPVVITVGSIHGGTQANIIPDEVKLELSVRTYTEDVRRRVLASIERVAKSEAAAANAPQPPDVEVRLGTPAVYNDPELTLRLAAALRKALGPENVTEMPPKMTSEDFAQYSLAGVPSALLHIGAVDPAKLAHAREVGIPVPAPHSPEWAPEREPTLKNAIRAEVTELLELLR
ncbi:MAG: amidohydrolase [Bryobacterales bacterium]|nr:amidohydrolase [Bryobacterales bacterium]MBV9400518.1 amidohydrolase [Bryobacterales bacterium]